MSDVGGFEPKLVRFNPVALKSPGHETTDERHGGDQDYSRNRQTYVRAQKIIEAKNGGDYRCADKGGEQRQANMDVGVSGAKNDAVVAGEQIVTLEHVSGGFGQKKDREEHGEVVERRLAEPWQFPRPIIDVAPAPIDQCRHCRSEE